MTIKNGYDNEIFIFQDVKAKYSWYNDSNENTSIVNCYHEIHFVICIKGMNRAFTSSINHQQPR